MNVLKMQNLFTSFSNHRLLNIFSQLWPRDVVLRQRLSWFNFHANPLHFTLMKKESLALFSQDFFCRKSGRSYSYPKLLKFCKLRLSWISYRIFHKKSFNHKIFPIHPSSRIPLIFADPLLLKTEIVCMCQMQCIRLPSFVKRPCNSHKKETYWEEGHSKALFRT